MTLLTSGCAEFTRHGGVMDWLEDSFWFRADTKKHRILRSYLLVGSVLNVATKSNLSAEEREVLAKRVNTAIRQADEAFTCAFESIRGCVFFDERLARLDSSIFRIAVAALYPEETRDLMSVVRKGLVGKVPVAGNALEVAIKATELGAVTAGAINEGAVAVASLLKLGETGLQYGSRIGPLYRDSLEMDMRVFLLSMRSSCSVPAAAACEAYDRAFQIYKEGAGDLSEIRRFLRSEATAYSASMTPAASHFMEASELIWRSCQNLLSTPAQLSLCRAYYPEGERDSFAGSTPKKREQARVGANKLILGACVEKSFEVQRPNAVARALELDGLLPPAQMKPSDVITWDCANEVAKPV
jgi:hypothetical protein